MEPLGIVFVLPGLHGSCQAARVQGCYIGNSVEVLFIGSVRALNKPIVLRGAWTRQLMFYALALKEQGQWMDSSKLVVGFAIAANVEVGKGSMVVSLNTLNPDTNTVKVLQSIPHKGNGV